MCRRSNYTQNAPQYERDCEYRISSNDVTQIQFLTQKLCPVEKKNIDIVFYKLGHCH